MSKSKCVCLLMLAGIGLAFFSSFSHTNRPLEQTQAFLRALPGRAPQATPIPSLAGRPPKTSRPLVSPSPSVVATSPGSPKMAGLSIPMTFEPNVGQSAAAVQFVGSGKGMNLFLTRDEIAVRVAKSQRPGLGVAEPEAGLLSLRLAGNKRFEWKGVSELPGQSNYFIGNNRNGWHTNVPHFERAETETSEPGVGMAVYGTDDGVEYDLRVAPGADVSNLRLQLNGANRIRLDANGDLLLNVSGNEVRMKKPRVYQNPHGGWHASGTRQHAATGSRRRDKYSPRHDAHPQSVPQRNATPSLRRRPRRSANPCSPHASNSIADTPPSQVPCGKRPASEVHSAHPDSLQEIAANYVIESDGSIGFHLGEHDADAALVIDPSLSVSYATFLGGSGSDSAQSVAVDSSGNIYISGTTASTSFPAAAVKRLGPADGSTNFFIAKINPALTGAGSLVYLDFLGGGGTQSGGVIVLDSAGDVALSGATTATDYPVTDTSAPTNGLASGLGNDLVISKINPSGNALLYSTLFGGSGLESQSGPGGIALDAAGDIYIASDVHTTAVDSASADLPVSTGSYSPTWDGQRSDAFFAILTPPTTAGSPTVVKYCTYLGTNSISEPSIAGVAVDVSGNAYIAGTISIGTNPFPTKNAIQSTYGGGSSDGFLLKIAPSSAGAADLVYSTLLGGSSADSALALALDSSNPPNAYVAGTTQSPDFPTNAITTGVQQSLHPGAMANTFLAVVSQDALSGQSTLAYSTYLGGSGTDAANGLTVVQPQAVYVAGSTTSWDMPWHNNLQPFNGASDAFVAKFDTTKSGGAGLIYLTPLGGTSQAAAPATASASAVVADGAGHVYVVGSTIASNFPTAVTTQGSLNGLQPACTSCGLSPASTDAFAAEIVESTTPLPSVYFNVGSAAFGNAPLGSSAVPVPVALYNGGDANLSISSMSISGPNQADFSVLGGASCTAQPIVSGPTLQCSFEMEFTPSVSGEENAVLLVSDNAPGSPQELELVANGQSSTPVSASPTSLQFGNQPENSVSPAMNVTVTNSGAGAVTGTAFRMAGADTGAFTWTPNTTCGATQPIATDEWCTVAVVFQPDAARTFSAQLQLTESTSQGVTFEQTVNLSGTGVPAAPLAVPSVVTIGFGSENVGATSAPQSIRLTNPGSAPLSLASIALSGANVSDFAVVSSAPGTTCPLAGGSLAVSTSCSVAVEFTPQATGAETASVVFADNAAPGSQSVALSGTATAVPPLQASPAALTFAAQSEGASSPAQIVTIANSGSSPVQVGNISVTGPNAGDFSTATSCTIPAGQSCQLSVTFTPAAASPGARTATLNLPTVTPSSVALAGAATQAAISVPTSMNFGTQLAGGAGGAPQPVVVTNSSSGQYAGALAISSVTKTGTNAGDFVISSDACTGASVAPASTCSIQVSFKPLASPTCSASGSSRSAVLTLTDNAPGSPHTVPLSGTAMSFCITTSPTQAVQGPITAGSPATYSLEVNSYSGFSGSAALACALSTQSGASEPIFVTGCTFNVSPATVSVTPTTPGAFQVTVNTSATPVSTSKLFIPSLPSARLPYVGVALAVCTLFLGYCLFESRMRLSRRVKVVQVAALVIACAVLIAACGGGGGAGDPPAPEAGDYPYNLVVTATFTSAGQPNVLSTFTIPMVVEVN
jgi:Beta-propeller repeat